MQAVLSISGGMDSTCLLINLLARGYTVNAFSFNYGQKHVLELERLDDNLKYLSDKGYKIKHKRIDLKSAFSTLKSSLLDPDIDTPLGHYENDNMKATVVPNRNAIFSSIIYAQAQSIANRTNQKVIISLGVHSGDHVIYPDCRPRFYSILEQAFKEGNWNSDLVDFDLPYLYTDKAGILRDALAALIAPT